MKKIKTLVILILLLRLLAACGEALPPTPTPTPTPTLEELFDDFVDRAKDESAKLKTEALETLNTWLAQVWETLKFWEPKKELISPISETPVEQCTREVPLIHPVQKGDTLLELAEDYDICITTLVECHKKETYPDITKELIRVGWQLNMPPPICEATPPSQREEEACMVEAINDYISEEEPDSPLKGYGERFVYWGRVCNVDPRLIVAIARKESELGTKPCANHNAWGIRPRGVCKDFDSWEAGIRYATKNIVRLHFCYYEKHTVEDMDRYCTSNCRDWAGLVSQFMRDIEDGDPDTLTFTVFCQ